MPLQSRVPPPVTTARLSELAQDILEKTPFDWQVEAALHILNGDDTILDVGTGNGKTLVFQLPLLADPQSINLIISPLSALMIEQVRTQRLGASVSAESKFKG